MSTSIEDLAFLSQFILEPIFLGKESIIADITSITAQEVRLSQPEHITPSVATEPGEQRPVPQNTHVKFLGGNISQILVLSYYTHEEHVSADGLALFEKMYKALRLDLHDFAIINVAKIPNTEFMLPEFKKLLILGDQAAQLLTIPALAQLPLKAKHTVVSNTGKKLLWANTFEEIGQMDNSGKKAFWDALKQLLVDG